MAKPSINGVIEKVWKIKTAPKINIFMWKALSNALSVNDGLRAKGMKVDVRCQRCGQEGESINHVLFTCPAARRVWAQSCFLFPRRGFEHITLLENFNYLLSLPKALKIPEELERSFSWLLWMIWKNRNSFIFEGKEFSAEDTIMKVMEDSKQWFDAQKIEMTRNVAMEHNTKSVSRWQAQGLAL